MVARRRIREGFRRMAIFLGVLGGLIGLLVGVFIIFALVSSAEARIAWLVVTSVCSYGICWGLVRVLGWIVEGFFAD